MASVRQPATDPGCRVRVRSTTMRSWPCARHLWLVRGRRPRRPAMTRVVRRSLLIRAADGSRSSPTPGASPPLARGGPAPGRPVRRHRRRVRLRRFRRTACWPSTPGSSPIDGRAILVAGRSGRGKTTLVLGLLRRGLDLLSDELALVAPDDSTMLAYPRGLHIRPSALDLFPELDHLADPPATSSAAGANGPSVRPPSSGHSRPGATRPGSVPSSCSTATRWPMPQPDAERRPGGDRHDGAAPRDPFRRDGLRRDLARLRSRRRRSGGPVALGQAG